MKNNLANIYIECPEAGEGTEIQKQHNGHALTHIIMILEFDGKRIELGGKTHGQGSGGSEAEKN